MVSWWEFVISGTENEGTNENRLQGEVLKRGISIHRTSVDNIRDFFESFPVVKTVFNCTGLGSHTLKGVEDDLLYPTRVCVPSTCLIQKYRIDIKQGQVMLVENPKTPMTRMYFRSPQSKSWWWGNSWRLPS
jgi:D-amino-acid oxidase